MNIQLREGKSVVNVYLYHNKREGKAVRKVINQFLCSVEKSDLIDITDVELGELIKYRYSEGINHQIELIDKDKLESNGFSLGKTADMLFIKLKKFVEKQT